MSTQEHEAAAETLLREVEVRVAAIYNDPDERSTITVIPAHWRGPLARWIAAALADAVREARKIAGCVSCEDHAALICNPCAAKGKADAGRVARQTERDRLLRTLNQWGGHSVHGNPVGWLEQQMVGEGDATAKSCWTGKRIPFLSHVCCHHVPCCICPPKGDATPGPELDDENLQTRNRADATPPKKGTGR